MAFPIALFRLRGEEQGDGASAVDVPTTIAT